MRSLFRSRRRDIVFTQHEHARLAAEIALAWRSEDVPLPRDDFARGVALHDRGFDALDTDAIGEQAPERHERILRSGLLRRDANPVADLVALLHIRRLRGDEHERARRVGEIDAILPELLEAAGVAREDALAANEITWICDRASFDFCLEEASSDEVGGIVYAVDGRGAITLDPWPLEPPRLRGFLWAYEAEGYPERLAPVLVPYRISPER